MRPTVQHSADPMAEEDLAHMTRALELAARGLYTTDPNPRVGCVIVREGRATVADARIVLRPADPAAPPKDGGQHG